MSSQTTVFLCFFYLFIAAYCIADDSVNTNTLYNDYISEVINFNEIKRKIQDSLLDSDDGIFAALKMFDASTKIPSGLAGGAFFDLGSFDECYSIQSGQIYGKYCLGTLSMSAQTQKYFRAFGLNSTRRRPAVTIHPQVMLTGLGDEYTGLHFAACVPSNWSASDIPGLLRYTEEFCYSKATEPDLSAGAIVTIAVLSVFLAIIVISTAFDIYLFYSKKDSPHELLIAFSFLSNGRKVFASTNNSDQLLCLNGIKAISMMWVILGHEYSTALNAPLSNYLSLSDWENDAANMIILGATVSVDTFFVVGGLVTVYVFLKSVDKGVKFNVILYYIHRYLRLTPALAIMSLIHLYLLNYVANGPLWKVIDMSLVKTCETGWWSTLLYITNYIQDGLCLPQTWYLSVDMQLFILSPLLLIPLTKWPKATLVALGVLSVAGCIVPFVLGYVDEIGTLFNGASESFMYDYYMQTYTRFGPYVIGMFLGYYLYRIKKSELIIRLPAWAVCVLWVLCLTGLVACVYAGYPLGVEKEVDRLGNAFFLGFDRPGWAVALSGVIFLCVSGYGGPVDKFLSLPIFQFLSKVSYSMYLVHFAVINIRYASLKNNIKFSNVNQMHVFWGDFMFTLFLALILCLAFESPIIILEKYLFGRGSSRLSHDKKKPEV